MRIATIQELTEQYARCDRFIHLYCYYWGGRDFNADAEDQIEGWVKAAFDTVGTVKGLFFGTEGAVKTKKMGDFFSNAFYRGYQTTKNHLNGTWGSTGVTRCCMTFYSQTYAVEYRKWLNRFHPIKSTSRLMIWGFILAEEINRTQHISNWLVKDSAIDLADQGVSIKGWNPETERIETDYIGVLEAREKFDDWAHEFHQVRGLSDIFTRPETKDIEYFIDIASSSLKAQRNNARETYRQSNKKAKLAAESGDYSEYAQRWDWVSLLRF